MALNDSAVVIIKDVSHRSLCLRSSLKALKLTGSDSNVLVCVLVFPPRGLAVVKSLRELRENPNIPRQVPSGGYRRKSMWFGLCAFE